MRLSSKRAAVLDIVDAMATRSHKDFIDAGAWPSSEKQRPLHAFDIELGRIMLGKGVFAGTVEEVNTAAYIFETSARCEVSLEVLARLPPCLP